METAKGQFLRLVIVALLLYGAYTVAFCPCVDNELLACHNHGKSYYGSLALAMLLIPVHHHVNE